jgi:hypothetical protein
MVLSSFEPESAWWEVYTKINSAVSGKLEQKSNKCTVIKKENKPTGGHIVLFAKHAIVQGWEKYGLR